MLRTYEVQDLEDVNNPLESILTAICFALRATTHTTLQASPTQLAFGRDHILNIKFEVDWQKIRERKQEIINKNNEKENKKRVPYTYTEGQKVLIKTEQSRKYGRNPYEGPYEVIEVRNNGSLRLKKLIGRGAIFETYNLRNVVPYEE